MTQTFRHYLLEQKATARSKNATLHITVSSGSHDLEGELMSVETDYIVVDRGEAYNVVYVTLGEGMFFTLKMRIKS